ncbi:ABC transporter permease [Salinimonas marina]|uniref:ABC transporter permease n=1 Tax=Salinimonas marina TaxID=2785918 RepID=A0A7S9DVE3_9ALTE|nr:ABC transporter permease [Salinimonas marina]QPG04693.1 ABC transporter permease [Salinimonas marina]
MPKSATYTVAAIYPDYGNPDSQLLLPFSTFSPDTGYAGVTALYGAAKSDLARLASLGEVYASSQLLKKSMQTFDRTFVVTDALNIATLLVAGMAFAVSVSVITLDLRPQLNVLRTMGVAQLQVKAMLTAQYMLLCLVTALLALPFGILLAWVFINMVNRFAFFWVYPMQVSVMVLLNSLALSLFVVLIILLLPIARIEGKVDLRQETPL